MPDPRDDESPRPVATRPEDMLEDGQDARVINGVQVRKGTLGAFEPRGEALLQIFAEPGQ